jgi:hypothetical protein
MRNIPDSSTFLATFDRGGRPSRRRGRHYIQPMSSRHFLPPWSSIDPEAISLFFLVFILIGIPVALVVVGTNIAGFIPH